MRTIDQENWPRKEHFNLYSQMPFPHVGICMQVDITDLWADRSRTGASSTIALTYIITKAANRVPELRQRIRGEQIVEHELVHPMIAILGGDNVFGMCRLTYEDHFPTFASDAAARIEKARENPTMAGFPHDPGEETHQDDLLSITVVPWLSFTGFSLTRQPQVDAVPLLAWGKVVSEGNRSLLPFFVNIHHALVDGVHIARFVEYIEAEAQSFASSLG